MKSEILGATSPVIPFGSAGMNTGITKSLFFPLLCFLLSNAEAQLPDTTPPEVSLAFSKAPYILGADTFTSADTWLILSSTDPIVSGETTSGVKNIKYAVTAFGASPPPPEQFTFYSDPFTLSEGSHTVYYASKDNAGNQSSGTAGMRVDASAPVTQLEISDADTNEIGGIFHASTGAVISLSASDPVSNDVASGVKFTAYFIDISPDSCTYEGPQISTEPAGSCKNYKYFAPFPLPLGPHSIYYRSKDNVGNNEFIHVASITIHAFASLSGTISITPELLAGSTVTVAVSTDYFRNNTSQFFPFTAQGSSLPYSLSLPAPATYYIIAFAGSPAQQLPPGTPIGVYGGYSPVFAQPGADLSGLNFSIFPDSVPPVMAVSSPANNSSVSEFNAISGTALDNTGVGSIYAAVKDLSAGLWWNAAGGIWISTDNALFGHTGQVFSGPPTASSWTIYSGGDNAGVLSMFAQRLAHGNNYRLYFIAEDFTSNFSSPPVTVNFTWTGPQGQVYPGSVTGISGEVLGTSSVTWTWQPPDGAAGYAVYSDTGIFLSSVTAGASFVQSGLAPNSPASVCVAAYNIYGEGAHTCSSALYTLADMPGIPETVSVSSYSISIKWSPNGNPAGTFYELNSSTDNFQSGSSTSAIVGSGAGDIYATVPGLSAATTYYMRVLALNNSSVPSAYSDTISTRTFAAPPDAPVNPAAAFSAASKKVSLIWSAASSGTLAASFRIYRAAEPSPASFLVRGATANTWFEDTIPLQYSSTYYYRITALNSDGLESDFSQTVSTGADVVAPGSVADLKVISTDSVTGRITLSWTAPWEDWGLDRYIIKAATNVWSDAQWDEAQTLVEAPASVPSGTMQTAALVLPSTDVVRYIALKAVDDFGNQSIMSNLAAADFEPPAIDVTCAVQANSIVGRPFGITIAAQDNYSISSVEYLVDGLAISTSFPQSPYFNAYYTWDTTNYSDGYHVFSVRIEDYSGNIKQWDLPVTVNYIPPAAPAITNPGVDISISTTTVSISGTAEPGTYVVIFAGDVFMASVYAYSGFFGTQITLSGDGIFSITAQAVDKKGSSPRSKPVSVIVDSGPPNPPRTLSAGSAAGGIVNLLWSLPTGEKPAFYNIYRSTDETAFSVGIDSAALRAASDIKALEYTDYPPLDGIYYFGATSVDAAGNESGLSNISAAVSDRLAPSASIAVSSVPPLGAGSYGVMVTVSETLAYAPYLTFTPYGQSPVQVYLTPENARIWRGTLTVTANMASSTGGFSFGGTDLSGNTGGPVTSGQTLTLETDGPAAALSLSSVKPALKAGTYAINLSLNKPAREAPALSYITQSGSTETVSLSSSTNAAAWTGAISIVAASGEGSHNFTYWAYDRLGNKGELLSGTTYFSVDTMAPGKPLSLNGLAGAAGAVNLSWSAPAGERPSAYCLYRDAQPVTCEIAPNPADFTGFYADTAPEGAHTYAVAALDAAGNESPLSDAVNINSDSTPPDAPIINSWSTQSGSVELGWIPGDAEIPAKYRLYRTTSPIVSVAGLGYRVVLGESVFDTPETDGWYYYALTALDAAGNESALSAPIDPIPYDGSAPLITVAGVQDGGYYNHKVYPIVEIQDLNLWQYTITLNNSPFVSGSTISAQGTYTLAVSALDLGGHSSQRSVSFTIDLTSPAVSVSGVQNGGYYEASVTPAISASDLNLSAVTAALNGSPFVSGSSVSAGGSYELSVLAWDKAGNASPLSISFTVNPPPAKPKNLSVTIEDGKTAVLTWESPAPGMVLYKVYKDGVYIGPAQTTDLSFRDTAYSASAVSIYEVSAIDSKGREGERARVEVPPVSLEVAGYGTYQDPVEALNRGFFDLVRLKISNNSAQAVSAGPLSVTLAENISGEAPAVNIAAGSSAEVSAAVYVSTGLPASVSARAVLTLPSNVSMVKNFALNVRDPKKPVVEVYPEALVRGNYSNVRLKLNNRGSAPLDIVTARLSGSRTVPSKAVAVELKTGAGLVLSRAEVAQTAGASIAIVGGEQLYFVSVPGGGSFTFEPVRPAVPQEAEQELVVEGTVGGPSGAAGGTSGLAYSLPFAAVYSPGVFISSKTALPGLAAPYSVTLAANQPFYDKESTVTLSGFYSDTWGNPLSGRPLLLTISNKGFERALNVTAGSDGRFAAQFVPVSGEAGVFEVSARHPDYIGEAAHSSFSVVGMEFGWTEYTLTMARNSSYTFEADFTNTGETPLEGLSATMQNISGLGVTASSVPLPAFIAAGTRQKLAVSLTAATNASETAELIFKITEANGFQRSLPIHVKTVPAQVIPKITPQVFEIGMLAGEVRTQLITVENIGFSTWTSVYVTTPTLSWVRINGLQNSLGDIGPGRNASFTIVFEPPAGMENGSYPQNPLVTITGGGASAVPVNASIVITSSRKGDILFNVANSDIPKDNPTGRLGGADLRLTSLDIAGMTLMAKTDSNGLARFEGVPAGKYMYKAETGGYNPVTGMVAVEPGLVKTVDIFMPTTMVTYKWSVTPTTIIDKYDITLEMTFRTDVPAPALIIDPPSLTLNMKGGETAYTQLTLKNKGLVSAFNLKAEINTDGVLHIETPLQNIAELKAGQSVVIPLKITLDYTSAHSGSYCLNGYYLSACGPAPAGACFSMSGGDVPTSGGGAGGLVGGGGGGFGFSGGQSYVPAAVTAPAAVKQCDTSGIGGQSKHLGQPNACGSGGDPLTGNYSEGFPNISLPPGSPGASYSFDYGSLAGLLGTGSYSLEPQPDGSLILMLPDGTKILFVPTGTLNPELTGNLPQFDHAAGYQSALVYSGGKYTLTEKDGTTTAFTKLNGVYKPSSLTDRNGGTLSYAYNASGNLTKITDVHDRNINITYNAAGKPLTVSDFTNRSASYEYDVSGNLIKATDLDGSQTSYTYDAQNRMTGIAYPNGAHKTMTYDGKNRVLTITEDNDNNKQTFEYLDASSQTKVTDALNRQTVYDYIVVDGKKEIAKITDPAGNITRYGYDEDLNRVSVTDALNRKTDMVYDGKGNMISVKDTLGNMTQMSYEATFNQVTSITDPKWNTTGMRYDLRGNVMEVADVLGNVSQMSYDALGHVTGTNDPLGNASLFEYDSYGELIKVTDPLNRTATLTRDTLHLGRVTQTMDPKNKLTLFDYDVKGNLTKVTDALSGITQYSYTGGCPTCGGGNLLASVKDAKNQQTTFNYDLQKRLTSVTNPLNQSKNFVYDKKGNLTSVTDAKNQTISFEYDVNDRLIKKTLPEGNVSYAYDAVGNLTVVAELALQTRNEFAYDAANRVTQTKQTVGGQTYTINYTYDNNGNRTSMTTPWGSYNYIYDSLNRLTSMTNPDAKTVTFAYDSLGRRTKMILPNGTETTYAYDGGSQLTQILHRKTADNTALVFSDYAYDLAGNRTSMQDITGTHSYGYDDLHRLVSAGHPVGSSLETKSETFAYDAVGNRLADAVMSGYTYDSANRLLSNSSYTYTYDANGNLTVAVGLLSDAIAYTYNSENQLINITMPDNTVVSFKYDPLGRRIEKAVTLPSTLTPIPYRYIYDNEDILAVMDKDNNVVDIFTHGPGIDEPLIMKKADTKNYYYHADGLGSIIALSDQNAAIIETTEYQAYGKPIIKNRTGAVFDKSIVGNPYQFTARELDAETGLFYYRARYYSAETGRFLQEDPQTNLLNIKGAKSYKSINLYRYVANNPVLFVDPKGTFIGPAGAALLIELGVGAALAVHMYAVCSNLPDGKSYSLVIWPMPFGPWGYSLTCSKSCKGEIDFTGGWFLPPSYGEHERNRGRI